MPREGCADVYGLLIPEFRAVEIHIIHAANEYRRHVKERFPRRCQDETERERVDFSKRESWKTARQQV